MAKGLVTEFQQGTADDLLAENSVLKPLSRARGWERVLWSVIFLAVTGVFIYNMVVLFNIYYAYPVVTLTEIVHDTERRFPAVTFCDLNLYKLSELSEIPALVSLSEILSQSLATQTQTANNDPDKAESPNLKPVGGSHDTGSTSTTFNDINADKNHQPGAVVRKMILRSLEGHLPSDGDNKEYLSRLVDENAYPPEQLASTTEGIQATISYIGASSASPEDGWRVRRKRSTQPSWCNFTAAGLDFGWSAGVPDTGGSCFVSSRPTMCSNFAGCWTVCGTVFAQLTQPGLSWRVAHVRDNETLWVLHTIQQNDPTSDGFYYGGKFRDSTCATIDWYSDATTVSSSDVGCCTSSSNSVLPGLDTFSCSTGGATVHGYALSYNPLLMDDYAPASGKTMCEIYGSPGTTVSTTVTTTSTSVTQPSLVGKRNVCHKVRSFSNSYSNNHTPRSA